MTPARGPLEGRKGYRAGLRRFVTEVPVVPRLVTWLDMFFGHVAGQNPAQT
jgi:hypothetical protein